MSAIDEDAFTAALAAWHNSTHDSISSRLRHALTLYAAHPKPAAADATAASPEWRHTAHRQTVLIAELRAALSVALDHYNRRVCTHENVHRGGVICLDCGAKWADDRGGFKPYVEPLEITKAHELLKGSADGAQPDTRDAALEQAEASSRDIIEWRQREAAARDFAIGKLREDGYNVDADAVEAISAGNKPTGAPQPSAPPKPDDLATLAEAAANELYSQFADLIVYLRAAAAHHRAQQAEQVRLAALDAEAVAALKGQRDGAETVTLWERQATINRALAARFGVQS